MVIWTQHWLPKWEKIQFFPLISSLVGKATSGLDIQKPHILLGIITITIDIHSENIYFSHFSH